MREKWTLTGGCLLASIMAVVGAAAGAGEAPRAPKDPPRVAALSPEQALRAFRIDAGLEVTAAAVEPNVSDPVDIAFDEDGRMWVAELWNYPSEPKPGEPLGRVRVLQSTRGDGVYDKSTIFADHLKWCSGVLPWDGGVFVVSAPDLLYLKDTDGDGKADLRKTVYTGFRGRTYEVANCLRWGMDNKIYVCGSYAGGSLRAADRADARPVDSHDFAFDPRAALSGEPAEAVSGSGEWGNAFNDWGERFTCDATDPIFHAVLPRRCLDRNPTLLTSDARENPNQMWARVYPISAPEPWKVARQRDWKRYVNTSQDMNAGRFPDSELAPQGFATSAAGVWIYRGSALPEEYRQCSYTGEPANNVVIRLKLEERGGSITAARPEVDQRAKREFLASTDNRFRPVNLADGPDGCLYVVSMYREIIEDESAIPDEILQHYDLHSGREMGRIYRIAPAGFTPPKAARLSEASAAKLVESIDSPNGWTRDAAQRLLYTRQDRAAIEPLRKLAMQASRSQSRVQALWTLAGLDALDAATLLGAMEAHDPHVTAAGLRLSEPLLDASLPLQAAVLAAAGSDDARVRFQAALSLGWLKAEKAVEALGRIIKRDAEDRWTQTAALLSSGGRGGALFNRLLDDAAFRSSASGAAFLGRLAHMIGVGHDPEEVGSLLAALGDERLASEVRRETAAQLADGLSRGGGSLAGAAERAPPSVRQALNELFDQARAAALDDNARESDRVEGVRLLAFAPRDLSAAALEALLDPTQPRAVQSQAIRALGAQDDSAVAATLIARWPQFGPAARGEALDVLFRRAQRLAKLLDALQADRIAPSELDADRRQALLRNADPAVRARAEKLLAAHLNSDRGKVVETLTAKIAHGPPADPARGRQVYQAVCFACHGKPPAGQRLAPDLAVLQDRSPAVLLTAILDPNRDVKPQFVGYDVEMKDGQSYLGVIANETASAVTLRRAGGAEETLLRSNIQSLRSTRMSLMPEGLESGLTDQQVADLIAFLQEHREK